MRIDLMTRIQFQDMVFNQVAASPQNGVPLVLVLASLHEAGWTPSAAKILVESMIKVGLLEVKGLAVHVKDHSL